VKAHELINGKILLTGLFDEDEDALKKDYANVLQSNKNESIPTNELILKCMFVFTLNNFENSNKIYSFNNNIEKKYFSFSQKSIAQYLSVNTPPPNA
jgi:hypothetical protein